MDSGVHSTVAGAGASPLSYACGLIIGESLRPKSYGCPMLRSIVRRARAAQPKRSRTPPDKDGEYGTCRVKLTDIARPSEQPGNAPVTTLLRGRLALEDHGL